MEGSAAPTPGAADPAAPNPPAASSKVAGAGSDLQTLMSEIAATLNGGNPDSNENSNANSDIPVAIEPTSELPDMPIAAVVGSEAAMHGDTPMDVDEHASDESLEPGHILEPAREDHSTPDRQPAPHCAESAPMQSSHDDLSVSASRTVEGEHRGLRQGPVPPKDSKQGRFRELLGITNDKREQTPDTSNGLGASRPASHRPVEPAIVLSRGGSGLPSRPSFAEQSPSISGNQPAAYNPFRSQNGESYGRLSPPPSLQSSFGAPSFSSDRFMTSASHVPLMNPMRQQAALGILPTLPTTPLPSESLGGPQQGGSKNGGPQAVQAASQPPKPVISSNAAALFVPATKTQQPTASKPTVHSAVQAQPAKAGQKITTAIGLGPVHELSLQCQVRRINPTWEPTMDRKGFYCSVTIGDSLNFHIAKPRGSCQAAKEAVAALALDHVRGMAIPANPATAPYKLLREHFSQGISASRSGRVVPVAAMKPKGPPATDARRPGQDKASSNNAPKTTSASSKLKTELGAKPTNLRPDTRDHLIRQIEDAIGYHVPEQYRTNELTSQAFLAGFSLGARAFEPEPARNRRSTTGSGSDRRERDRRGRGKGDRSAQKPSYRERSPLPGPNGSRGRARSPDIKKEPRSSASRSGSAHRSSRHHHGRSRSPPRDRRDDQRDARRDEYHPRDDHRDHYRDDQHAACYQGDVWYWAPTSEPYYPHGRW